MTTPTPHTGPHERLTAKPTYLPIPTHPPPVLDRFSWPRVGDAPARSGKENQSPPHVFARTRELPAWCQSVSAARCGLPLRFTRGSGCVFEVLLLREGVGRGSPRPRRLRRSRCRITLASKARLPDPPLLTRLHPPRTQASCSCGPRLQKRCWVRCGEPWRSPPRISPTTSDIVPGAVVRHPDDHPFAREGGLEDAPPHQRCLPVPERTPRDMPARLPAAPHSGSPAPSTLKGLGCAAKRRVPQSFVRQCQAHPCHGHAASRRRPLCACLPCQTNPLAFRCHHPPCRLPALLCTACLPACRLARWITGDLNAQRIAGVPTINAQRIAGVPTMSRAERRAAACPGLSTCLPPAFAAPAVPNRPPCLPVAAVRRAARLSACPPADHPRLRHSADRRRAYHARCHLPSASRGGAPARTARSRLPPAYLRRACCVPPIAAPLRLPPPAVPPLAPPACHPARRTACAIDARRIAGIPTMPVSRRIAANLCLPANLRRGLPTP